MTRIGFYPGSFDHVTRGHADIVARAARLFDELVIGVGVHPGKAPLFAADERIAMLETECAALAKAAKCKLRIVTFDGLTVDAAREAGASVILRGVRDGTDLNYEMQLAGTNSAMAPAIDTLFLPASSATRHIAANLVRQIAGMGGDVSALVSKDVAKRLAKRAAKIRA